MIYLVLLTGGIIWLLLPERALTICTILLIAVAWHLYWLPAVDIAAR
jgi:hypothetical protein